VKKSKLTPAQEMARIAVSIGRAHRILAKARTRAMRAAKLANKRDRNRRDKSDNDRLFFLVAGAAVLAGDAAYHALLLASNFGVLLRRDDPLLHVEKLGSNESI
jgi:hypothetical protein